MAAPQTAPGGSATTGDIWWHGHDGALVRPHALVHPQGTVDAAASDTSPAAMMISVVRQAGARRQAVGVSVPTRLEARDPRCHKQVTSGVHSAVTAPALGFGLVAPPMWAAGVLVGHGRTGVLTTDVGVLLLALGGHAIGLGRAAGHRHSFCQAWCVS
jgi:hypothetical protein